MNSINESHTKVIGKLVDFIILSALFFLASQIIPWSFQENILMTSMIYAVVVIISLQICQHLIQSAFKSTNSVIQLMLNYAAGLIIGTCVMLVIGFIAASMEGLAVVAILASIMAFFVLGTVSPLAKSNRHITH